MNYLSQHLADSKENSNKSMSGMLRFTLAASQINPGLITATAYCHQDGHYIWANVYRYLP
jgi:hypothetical protein